RSTRDWSSDVCSSDLSLCVLPGSVRGSVSCRDGVVREGRRWGGGEPVLGSGRPGGPADRGGLRPVPSGGPSGGPAGDRVRCPWRSEERRVGKGEGGRG